MAKRKGPDNDSSSERSKWEKILGNLLKVLQAKETELDLFAAERKLLVDQIRSYHDRWVSDVDILKNQILKMNSEITILELLRNVDAAKSNSLVGMKQREALIYKARLDSTVDDLKDLKDTFDCITDKHSEDKENVSKISALMSERDFIWNQYRKMESDLTEKLNTKKLEIGRADEKVRRLLQDVEQLRSSNSEKDLTICKLESELQAVSMKKSEELSRLTGELDMLRKVRNDSVTPSLRSCSVTLHVGDKKKDSIASRAGEKETRSSKRKAAESTPRSGTPKLFTSAFKVPKLKNSSPIVT